VTDMMTSQFDSNYLDEDENKQSVYEQMRHSLNSKQQERMKKEIRSACAHRMPTKFATMKMPKYKKKKSRISRKQRRIQTMKKLDFEMNELFRGLPVLKIKTLRKSESKMAFGRSKKTRTKRKRVKRRRDPEQTKIKVSNGKNEYKVEFGGLNGANIDFEITKWIDYGNVMSEIKDLRHRFSEHVIDESERMRTQLMRSGTCPDLLIKYQTMDHPKVLHQYVKHFKLPIPANNV